MKIAIPIWLDRISPVFDVAETLLVISAQDNSEQSRTMYLLRKNLDLISRAECLAHMEIDLIICGAISKEFQDVVEKQGIQVLPHICGNYETIIQDFFDGTFDGTKYAMPGCCKKITHNKSRHSKPNCSNTYKNSNRREPYYAKRKPNKTI